MKVARFNVVWKIGMSAMAIFGAIATSEPEKPKPPIKGHLEYSAAGVVLVEQEVTHARVASVGGHRCYHDESGTWKDHYFVFDDSRDKVVVNITDSDGVNPGKSYEYALYFKRSDGTIKPGAAYRFRLNNPFTASEPKFSYSFVLSVDSSDPNVSIPKGTELAGVYELSETDRNLAVDLDFQLKTDIPYSGVCSDYN